MSVRRIVPNSQSTDLQGSAEFYAGLLGMEKVMDLGWIVTLADPSDPSRQLSVATHDESAPVVPDVSVEVYDVDAAYESAKRLGAEIVHPITDESWGVRRFFVRGPDGRVLNVLSHP